MWRNEKPGPGRFRQFTQFDADTVGTDNIAADAEICMLAADTMEALGIKRGDYVIKVNNRKVLDGLLEAIGIGGDENVGKRLTVLRAIDKFDRLGVDGVRQLLGGGRKDESGDFTKGAGLSPEQADTIIKYLTAKGSTGAEKLAQVDQLIRGSEVGAAGVSDLVNMLSLCHDVGYAQARVGFDPSCVRGLEYYTGPVFEAEITIPVVNEDGQTVRFGSVGGGGRYDGLVERFLGTKVPATGFSIGVSRLQAALAAINKDKPAASEGPVVVLVMEKDRLADYQKMAQSLRQAGIRAEMYLGTAGMKAQMKYADKRGAPCVVIQGGDERILPTAPWSRSRISSKAPRPPPPSRTARNGAKAARRKCRCPKPTSSPPSATSSLGTRAEPCRRCARTARRPRHSPCGDGGRRRERGGGSAPRLGSRHDDGRATRATQRAKSFGASGGGVSAARPRSPPPGTPSDLDRLLLRGDRRMGDLSPWRSVLPPRGGGKAAS